MKKINVKLLNKIRDGAISEATNPFEGEARVSYCLISIAPIEDCSSKLQWTDCFTSNLRLTASSFQDCSFDRVVFLGCDLSGVSFVNCLFRDCFIVNVKSSSHISFINCNLDNIVCLTSQFENIEIQNTKIGEVTFARIRAEKLIINDCYNYKRKGSLSIIDSQFSAVGGLEDVTKIGVKVNVDSNLWRDLGDFYLKQKGIEEFDVESGSSLNRSLSEALELVL